MGWQWGDGRGGQASCKIMPLTYVVPALLPLTLILPRPMLLMNFGDTEKIQSMLTSCYDLIATLG